MASSSSVLSAGCSWQVAVLLMAVVAVTAMDLPVKPVDEFAGPEDGPGDECPNNCNARECKEKADLDELYPGVFRNAEDYAEEIPEGCSASFNEEARDNSYGTLSCTSRAEARFSSEFESFLWGDGNCCCPAHRRFTCPQYIEIGSTTYTVVTWSFLPQCFVTALCGIEKGICQGECKPIYHYRPILVYDPIIWLRWVYYPYVAACRCSTCTGGYCTSGFFLGDGIDK